MRISNIHVIICLMHTLTNASTVPVTSFVRSYSLRKMVSHGDGHMHKEEHSTKKEDNRSTHEEERVDVVDGQGQVTIRKCISEHCTEQVIPIRQGEPLLESGPGAKIIKLAHTVH